MELVLVINVGSTSLKWRWFTDESEGRSGSVSFDGKNSGEVPAEILREVTEETEVIVLHRIVHGGMEFREVTELTLEVVERLWALVKLAPLHQPPALRLVTKLQQLRPKWRHYGVFDTAFHATLPESRYLYPLPLPISRSLHIRRYGFHGISHGSVAKKISEFQPEATRVVSVHLGGGGSVCGLQEFKSVYVSMGLTPEEGLIMATRSGTIPAGVVLALLRNGYSVEDVESVLNRKSGLAGLAGTGDLARLLARNDESARLAIAMYVERAAAEIAKAVVALGGLDALVFTGKIGWRSEVIRQKVLQKLRIFGFQNAPGKLVRPGVRVQQDGSKSTVWALEPDEEKEMYALYRRKLFF